MSEESHIVKSYEEELQNLHDTLIQMGALTESQLSDSLDGVIKVDNFGDLLNLELLKV